MSVTPRFLDEIRARLSLSDIVGRRVRLLRAGREYKGCCPFHSEKSPSFYVNNDKQFYHCFGCGAHGDVVGFVMQHDNLSFIDAVAVLASEAGLEMPRPSPEEIVRDREEKTLLTLMDEAAKWFEAQLYLPENDKILAYARERGLVDQTLREFRIGYAPYDSQALRTYLINRGYTDSQMVEANVLKRGQRADPYAFFRERLMFPVQDRRGRVVAFGGRILPDHMRRPQEGDFKPPKYINSGDTPLFHKGHLLYSESRARQAVAESQDLLVVEGYMDVIACCQGGFRGAVAPLGTALTEDQIALLWRMIPHDDKIPVLCFDGDDAGRRAASRAAERIIPQLKPSHSARFAFLPQGEDPDSLIKGRGPQAFQGVLDSALSMADFIWQTHTADKDFRTPEARAGLAAQLEQVALRIADRGVQMQYQKEFRDRVYSAFARQGQAGKGRRGAVPPVPVRLPAGRVSKPLFGHETLVVSILLAALINHPDLFHEVEEELGALSIADSDLNRVRQSLIGAIMAFEGGADGVLDAARLRTHLTSGPVADMVSGLLSEKIYTHAGFARPETELEKVRKGWQETVQFLRRRHLDRELKSAGRLLAHEFTEENEDRLMAFHKINKVVDSDF